MLPAMVYTYTINHETGISTFPYVSDYCENMFGIPASDIVANPEEFVNLVHPDDVNTFTASVLQSMTRLTTWDLQMRMLNKLGEVIYVHGKSSPRKVQEKNEDGTTSSLTVWSGVLFQIDSKQMHAKDEMQDNSNNSSLNGELLCCTDKNGQITEWSEKMIKLTGFNQMDVFGKPFTSTLVADSTRNQENVDRMFDEDKRVAADGNQNSTSSKYLNFLSKFGNGAHIYVVFRKKLDDYGNILGYSCYCENFTNTNRAPEEKFAVFKLLDAENDIAEWLSHEIRNPLSVAMEAANVLKDLQSIDASTPGTKETPAAITNAHDPAINIEHNGPFYVDLICRSIGYIADLLTNILDLNKIKEGEVILRPSLCNVREEILIPTQQMMGIWIENPGASVPIRIMGQDDIQVYVDKLRLKQVIANLLCNALKYTTEGFIDVDVKTVSRDDDEIGEDGRVNTLIVTVSDSGSGVNPSDYGNLFSRWNKLGSSINGAGTGLYLCNLLVQAMMGSIYLNKEYNSGVEGYPGSQFVIELPMNSVLAQDHRGNAMHSISAFSAVSAAVKATASSRKAEAPSHEFIQDLSKCSTISNSSCIRGKFHLLVVDDDHMGRKMLKRRFSRLFPDAVVDDVSSGEKAIKKIFGADQMFYDIIFIDHFMAIDEMNGDEVIRVLRDGNVDSLIVGISGNAKEAEHISAGAEEFFQKPMPRDEIVLQRLTVLLPPPAAWRVLVVDNVKLNCHFFQRKLRKVSSAHFTTMEMADRHWSISTSLNAKHAMSQLHKESFDLIVLDDNLATDNLNATDVANFAREISSNKEAIIVLVTSTRRESNELLHPFNMTWSKPLPSVEIMRRSLCLELIKTKLL